MKSITKDIIAYDDFAVLDEDNNNITGLVTGDFTFGLYNPSDIEVSSSIPVTIAELENGLYRASFTPNAVGDWLLVIYHATYFDYGKAMNYECYEHNIDGIEDLALESTSQAIKTETDKIQPDIISSPDDYKADVSDLATSIEIANLEVLVKRILGLTQENFRISDAVYDSNHLLTSATIKIYSSSSDCENDINALETYSMTTVYNSEGEMTSYKVVKN